MSKVHPNPLSCHCTCDLHHSTDPLTYEPPPQSVNLPAESSAPSSPSRSHPIAIDNDPQSIQLLQFQVCALKKYKTNYELLCSQLSELNAQIGLQLQRHEADVSAMNVTITALQTSKQDLEEKLHTTQAQLEKQREIVTQDREYVERVHQQLTTAAELLKATEHRLEAKEAQLQIDMETLQRELSSCQDDNANLRHENRALGQELEQIKRTHAAAVTEQQEKYEQSKRKYKHEIALLNEELDSLTNALERQRGSYRCVKKQLQATHQENEALQKQLAHVKDDVNHLTTIIDSQKVTAQDQALRLTKWKKAKKQLDVKLASAIRDTNHLQAKFVSMQEELVQKNSTIEAYKVEIKNLRQEVGRQKQQTVQLQRTNGDLGHQLELIQQNNPDTSVGRHQNNLQHSSPKNEREGDKVEDERIRMRRYRREMDHMKHLLAMNHQRVNESSKDVQSLKRELFNVQEMLHKAHKPPNRMDLTLQSVQMEDQPQGEEDEDIQRQRAHAEVEESVLKRAIMNQVRQCA